MLLRFSQNPEASDPLPLKELSLEGVSALLSNCGYFSLVDSFKIHVVHGRILDAMDSFEELIQIDNSIKDAKGRGFISQLFEWKAHGVPREKLKAREVSSKVSTSLRCVVLTTMKL